jgi:hypothetical protein
LFRAYNTIIIDPLCKLFNNILSTGKFPVVWAKGIIVPIFKSGEKCNPSNYRGITNQKLCENLQNRYINV